MEIRDYYYFLRETWREAVFLDDEAVDIAMMEYQEDIINSFLTCQPEKQDRVNWIKEGF